MHLLVGTIPNELRSGLQTDRMETRAGNIFGGEVGSPFSRRESSVWNGLAGRFSQAERLRSFKKQLDSFVWGAERLAGNAP